MISDCHTLSHNLSLSHTLTFSLMHCIIKFCVVLYCLKGKHCFRWTKSRLTLFGRFARTNLSSSGGMQPSRSLLNTFAFTLISCYHFCIIFVQYLTLSPSTLSQTSRSFFYHFCQEHYHFANLERFLVTSLVVDLKVLLQHHLVVTHLVTLAFVIRIWPNMLILDKHYLSPKR